MRISEDSLIRLQELLKQKTDSNYDGEKAQMAGRAILRLAGIKLYQVYEQESING